MQDESMKEMLNMFQEEFINLKPHERIGYLRRRRNMTKAEMAERCITTQKCIWSWETGESKPSKRNRKIIAAVLEVNEQLIFGKLKKYEF